MPGLVVAHEKVEVVRGVFAVLHHASDLVIGVERNLTNS